VRGELLLRAGRLRDAATELGAITARVESRWPPGHARRVGHDVRRAILDLALDRPDSALARFDGVTAALGARVPPTYPFRVAAGCGRAVALARLGRLDEVRSALAEDCDRYRRYGIHVPQLVRWANDAAAGTTAGSPTREG
jgi:hypothetical protein